MARDLPDDDGGERVRLYAANSLALYFLTHGATKDGSASVRYGKERVYACMTCTGAHESEQHGKAKGCPHTKMTREWWEWLTPEEQQQAIALVSPREVAAEPSEDAPAAVSDAVPVAAGGVEPVEWIL